MQSSHGLRDHVQDLRKAADLTADRVGKADCQMECGMILQKQKEYRAATSAFEVRTWHT